MVGASLMNKHLLQEHMICFLEVRVSTEYNGAAETKMP